MDFPTGQLSTPPPPHRVHACRLYLTIGFASLLPFDPCDSLTQAQRIEESLAPAILGDLHSARAAHAWRQRSLAAARGRQPQPQPPSSSSATRSAGAAGKAAGAGDDGAGGDGGGGFGRTPASAKVFGEGTVAMLAGGRKLRAGPR